VQNTFVILQGIVLLSGTRSVCYVVVTYILWGTEESNELMGHDVLRYSCVCVCACVCVCVCVRVCVINEDE